jgi:hypothetical protein
VPAPGIVDAAAAAAVLDGEGAALAGNDTSIGSISSTKRPPYWLQQQHRTQ